MQQVRGQLAVGVVPDVLRHVAFLRESGRLKVRSEAGRGWISVEDGRPLHAMCERVDGSTVAGLDALAAMLEWSHGSYAFEDARDAGTAGTSRDPVEFRVRSLVGDVEAILERAHAYRGRRNGHAKNGRNGHAAVEAAASVAAPAPNGAAPAPNAPREAGEPVRTKPTSVLYRAVMPDPALMVTLSFGALTLWSSLDGSTTLAELAERLEDDEEQVRRRADELLHGGLAGLAPEPVYGAAFVSGLIHTANEIMGPMGEIVVEDALYELRLDPAGIPLDRVDELTALLARQLRRSDWQLKLRARVARLRAETLETRAEETH